MLDRILHRGLGLGAQVTVLTGLYEGSSGQITEVADDGTFRVTIDECCQPFVAAADLRVLKGRSFSDKAAEAQATIAKNPEAQFIEQQGQSAVPFGQRPF